MRLWMIARAELWTALREAGELRADPALPDHGFAAQYAWLRGQMARRVPGYRGGTLWWAWHTYQAERPKPDLRLASCQYFPSGTPAVRLELEVPAEEVLLSDFDLWAGIILNNGFVSLSEAEDAEWDALPLGQSSLEAKQRSWERIFDLRYPGGDAEWMGDLEARAVQATFEVLRQRDVIAVTQFRSRRSKRGY